VKLQKVGIITFEGEHNGKYEDKTVTVSNHTECQCQCQWETVRQKFISFNKTKII
jgi:hypothetical protein